MKKQSFIALAILISGVFFISCKSEKKTEVKEAVEVEERVIDAADSGFKVASTSILNWKANQIGGGHYGTFNVESGTISLSENSITGGSFVIDIKSLKVTDVKEKEDNKDITDHLLNPDFFDSDKFPKAYFTITKVEGAVISGNLKMKGIEKNISFPVKLNVTDNTLSLTSDTFTIDRTVWGITKSSGKFFDPVKLGDHLIKDDVELSINITAKR